MCIFSAYLHQTNINIKHHINQFHQLLLAYSLTSVSRQRAFKLCDRFSISAQFTTSEHTTTNTPQTDCIIIHFYEYTVTLGFTNAMPFPHHNGTNENSDIGGRKSVSVMSSLTPELIEILHQTHINLDTNTPMVEFSHTS